MQMMKRSDLENYLKTANESAEMILRNLRRAAEIIYSFKQVAGDQTSEHRRRFKLRAYLDEILQNLYPALKKTPHSVTILCPDTLELNSYPGMFSQIITNFVMNSLILAFLSRFIRQNVVRAVPASASILSTIWLPSVSMETLNAKARRGKGRHLSFTSRYQDYDRITNSRRFSRILDNPDTSRLYFGAKKR